MKPEDIQHHIGLAGKTQASIADELGVSPMSVSKVIHRVIVSDRIMKHIAQVIGCDHKLVFPEYYLMPPKRATSKSEYR